MGKTRFDHKKICELYESGLSMPKICKLLGCTTGCVIPALKKNNIKMRSISDAIHLAYHGKTYRWGHGYIGFCPEKNKRMPYHRYLMEQHLGRKLGRNEVVHHIDGNPQNNSLDNLIVMSRSEHTKLHHQQGDIKK